MELIIVITSADTYIPKKISDCKKTIGDKICVSGTTSAGKCPFNLNVVSDKEKGYLSLCIVKSFNDAKTKVDSIPTDDKWEKPSNKLIIESYINDLIKYGVPDDVAVNIIEGIYKVVEDEVKTKVDKIPK